MAIGQQIRGLLQRARGYWADLTDASGQRAQADREEREDAVHQRYGGVRSPGGRDDMEQRLRERQESSQDRGTPDAVMANPAARAARSGQGNPGGQSRRNNPMQAGNAQMQAGRTAGSGQTSRQYAQQGGSGIQKTLGEQLGDEPRPAAPGASRGRGGPGQRG